MAEDTDDPRGNAGGDYEPGDAQFGDADSGGLAAEPGDEDDAGQRDSGRVPGEDEPSGFADLTGTPTGDLGGATGNETEEIRDMDERLEES